MRFIFITVLFGFGRAQEALVPSAQLRQSGRSTNLDGIVVLLTAQNEPVHPLLIGRVS
jgi:hypothetical protein